MRKNFLQIMQKKKEKTYSTLPGIEHLSFDRLVWVTVNGWEVKLFTSFEGWFFRCFSTRTTTLRAKRPINYETTNTISGQEADGFVQVVGRKLRTTIYIPYTAAPMYLYGDRYAEQRCDYPISLLHKQTSGEGVPKECSR